MKVETVIKRIRAIVMTEGLPQEVEKELAEIERDLRLEKIKLGKLRVIKVRTGDDKEIEDQDIFPIGEHLGIGQPDPGSRASRWSVYHIASGTVVHAGLTKLKAIKLAKILTEWPIQWESVTIMASLDDVVALYTDEQIAFIREYNK